jgi:UDP-N-acetylglucosamine--N-acetylmuramyl-(pentapeptide) pyrophosphoryl-undecaprenol N-acetylglucosamine transferase
MPAEPTWLLIAGGGTGGHVIPALAVARALVDRGHAAESIHFLGSERGVEVDMVPEAGFGLTVLPGRGLNSRSLDLDNLRAAIGLVRAAVLGVREVRRRRPAVVLSLGGYAAVAGVIGAVIWRVPLVVTEQNAVGSLANRLAGRFAKACAVPFSRTDLPKAVVTGNPVRTEIVEAAEVATDPDRRVRLRAEMGISPASILVVVMSGSLGARSVNRAAIAMTEQLAGRDDIVIHHVIGRRDWHTEDAPAPALADDAPVDYRAVEYESDAPRLLAAADLLIGRAGGSTVAELSVVGVASILVPLPIAPRDAQFHNAEALVEAGAAIRITDVECTGSRLAEIVNGLLSDDATLPAMAAAARSVGHPDAAERVALLCEEHARR